MAAVTFDSVSHSYHHHQVLHDINFSVKDKQVTVILGKSGSGKSTLLQMINGLIVPDSGIVSHFNVPINYKKLSVLRLGIGYSVQGTGLFPHMTIYENISLPAKIAKANRDETRARVEMLMEFVNLDKSYLTKYPFQLSGGEQQRVGICRAMILNPRLFILDEPFGALDLSTRYEIHAELINLQKAEPRTIIMVTHDVQEAFKLGQKILILDDGRVIQFDTPDKILHNPANDLVEKFVTQVMRNGYVSFN